MTTSVLQKVSALPVQQPESSSLSKKVVLKEQDLPTIPSDIVFPQELRDLFARVIVRLAIQKQKGKTHA